MAIRKIKLSELPEADSLNGLYVLGCTSANRSAKVSIVLLKGNKGDTGAKPLLRKTATAIEYKYEGQPDSAYQTLVTLDTLKLYFSDLTEEEKEGLKLHFSDLATEDISVPSIRLICPLLTIVSSDDIPLVISMCCPSEIPTCTATL
jgi:hypothetical protein